MFTERMIGVVQFRSSFRILLLILQQRALRIFRYIVVVTRDKQGVLAGLFH